VTERLIDACMCEQISQQMEGLDDKRLDSWIDGRRDKMKTDWSQG
jgi:hypothetical protein